MDEERFFTLKRSFWDTLVLFSRNVGLELMDAFRFFPL